MRGGTSEWVPESVDEDLQRCDEAAPPVVQLGGTGAAVGRQALVLRLAALDVLQQVTHALGGHREKVQRLRQGTREREKIAAVFE